MDSFQIPREKDNTAVGIAWEKKFQLWYVSFSLVLFCGKKQTSVKEDRKQIKEIPETWLQPFRSKWLCQPQNIVLLKKS